MSKSAMSQSWFAKGADGRYNNSRNTWLVDDEEAGCSEAAPITLEDGTVIAFAVASAENYFMDDRVDNVARLIATAPDLLYLARFAERVAESIDHDPDSALGELANLAKSLIAKATGQ